ncbi:hypothetical protein EMCRGX_G004764 [Ephydatia muelleri]|eukprot:Em0007g698a
MIKICVLVLCTCLWISSVQGSQSASKRSPPTTKTSSAFNALAREHGVYAVGGASCQAGQGADVQKTVCSSCGPVFGLCAEVYQVVSNINDTSLNASAQSDLYHVYTYGSAIAVFMMAMSLLCLVAVPCLRGSKHGKTYKAMRLCVMASGASALFCYCVLFLMMEMFRLNASPSEDNPSLIKCVVIIAGMYFFYLLEFTLHLFSGGHSHGEAEPHPAIKESRETSPTGGKTRVGRRSIAVEPSPPIGSTEIDTSFSNSTEIDTSFSKSTEIDTSFSKSTEIDTSFSNPSVPIQFKKQRSFIDPAPFPRLRTVPPRPPWHHITPLSWLVGVGDGMRNFVDGLALGVALTENITLGIATAIMLVIYEIPLEFGNFVLLLDNDVRWWVAVIFNMVSSLMFWAGLIAGSIFGDQLGATDPWVTAILFGVYSYIALVNLVPELVSVHEGRLLAFVMTHIGFFFSFGALFVPAYYRDRIETLLGSNSTYSFV